MSGVVLVIQIWNAGDSFDAKRVSSSHETRLANRIWRGGKVTTFGRESFNVVTVAYLNAFILFNISCRPLLPNGVAEGVKLYNC